MNVSDIFICGLATDYCVEYTAIDGVGDGFNTSVIVDVCRGIADDLTSSYDKMEKANVNLVEYMNLVI